MTSADHHGIGDPRASTTLLVGLIGTVLLLAVVLFAQVLFQNAQWLEDQRKIYEPPPRGLLDAQATQLAPISQYAGGPQAGRVIIPVDRAIELWVDDRKSSSTMPTIPTTPASTPAAGPNAGSQAQP